MGKKYQVFISSTYSDLIEERNAVMQCLLEMNCIPVGMEQFPASNMSQMEYIKMMLDTCDYYILILAGRYGSVDTDGIGYTEKEYNYALEKNIPIMSFVIHNVENLPLSKCEKTDQGKAMLQAFREKVCNGKLVKFFSDVNSLKAAVTMSIGKCIVDFPAVGWVRGNDNGLTPKDLTVHCSMIGLSATTKRYANEADFGSFTFDYSNNNGSFTIGKDDYSFETKWSKASNTSIHAYSDAVGIEAIARIKGPFRLTDKLDGEYDFSSRCRTVQLEDAIIWKNKNGHYAVTKVIAIKDDTRGDQADEITCEYVIFSEAY